MCEWLSIAEYARVYGLSRPTVYKLIDAQLLIVFRTSGAVNLTRVRNQPPKDSAA